MKKQPGKKGLVPTQASGLLSGLRASSAAGSGLLGGKPDPMDVYGPATYEQMYPPRSSQFEYPSDLPTFMRDYVDTPQRHNDSYRDYFGKLFGPAYAAKAGGLPPDMTNLIRSYLSPVGNGWGPDKMMDSLRSMMPRSTMGAIPRPMPQLQNAPMQQPQAAASGMLQQPQAAAFGMPRQPQQQQPMQPGMQQQQYGGQR